MRIPLLDGTLPGLVLPVLLAVMGHLAGGLLGLPFQALALGGFLLLGPGAASARPFLLSLALGALWALPPLPPPSPAPAEPSLLRFEGRLLEDARRGEGGGSRARIRVGGRVLRLQVTRDPGASLPVKGQVLSGLCWYRPREGSLMSRPGVLRILRKSLSPPDLRGDLCHRIESLFRKSFSRRTAPLFLRLLLGRGSDLRGEDLRTHRRLGLSHLLAISGLHAVFLAGLLHLLLRPFLGRRSLPVLAPCLLFYCWMTGFRPPILRAVLAYLFWLYCREGGRAFSLGSALGLACLMTLVLFPADLGSPSFLLSYAATAGLAWMTPWILSGRAAQPGRFSGGLLRLLAASLSAQIATATLCLCFFGYLSPWGILLTPLALPVVLLLLLLALLLPALHLGLPPLVSPLSALGEGIAGAYLEGLAALETLPLAPLHPLGRPPPLLAPSLLCGGLGLALLLRSRPCFFWACLLSSLPFFLPWPREGTRSLELLPVGHGQCALILDRDRSLAFDCGDSLGGGRASSALVSALHQAGWARLDHLVLSHGDQDHAGGLPQLFLRIPIGKVWFPESPKAGPWMRLCRRFGLPFEVLPPGGLRRPFEGAELHLPHPEGDLAGGNDGAQALFYRFSGGPGILLTGDQEEPGIHALLDRFRERSGEVEVLVLPHHASGHPSLLELCRELDPLLCLASLARREASPRFWRRLLSYRPWTTGESGRLRLEEGPHGGFVLRVERGRGL